jgi:TnpA family transposase
MPGTLRDSLVLLAVVLEQPTELNPIEIMTDTGAYTDVVFGLFWLLGYRFSPRIAEHWEDLLRSPAGGIAQARRGSGYVGHENASDR